MDRFRDFRTGSPAESAGSAEYDRSDLPAQIEAGFKKRGKMIRRSSKCLIYMCVLMLYNTQHTVHVADM